MCERTLEEEKDVQNKGTSFLGRGNVLTTRMELLHAFKTKGEFLHAVSARKQLYL